MEDPKGNSPKGMDGNNLQDGVGDRGFDLNDYGGVDSPSPSATASLLPLHIKVAHIAYHYEQQEQQC